MGIRLTELIFDTVGNLYGTTPWGSSGAYGTVFELSPTAEGRWRQKVLHNSRFSAGDGNYPADRLIFDAAGNLYGTAEMGGAYGYGIVFELSPKAGGGWTEKVLHNFDYNGRDGFYPYAGVISDTSGNLYGTTADGGAYGGTYIGGTVYQLTPTASGLWTEKVLHNFSDYSTDGGRPFGGLFLDNAGNLYGTTQQGGAYGSRYSGKPGGTVFKLTPTADGSWTETILHSYGKSADGNYPYTGVIFDTWSNLYATTASGGAYGGGTVFEITP